MSQIEIKNNLKVLGIISQEQLSNKMNLEYWWRRNMKFNYQKIKIDKIN